MYLAFQVTYSQFLVLLNKIIDQHNKEVIDINNLQIGASNKKEAGFYRLSNSSSPLSSTKSYLLQLLHQSYVVVAQEILIFSMIALSASTSSSQMVHDHVRPCIHRMKWCPPCLSFRNLGSMYSILPLID